ncbi:aspartyl protease family protein [Psychroserpens algicola]|uniref:Aspartyl protease family protein n=1 Tax=Psychroserpens algicola TaxID=1719034 RepID=A0ABT0HAA0_9FLAO|nr:aspartyl protease family protein [Psychroserpens algicola]MCK8481291.1 aspartyl protease family protein [Psychroserpens algicola]
MVLSKKILIVILLTVVCFFPLYGQGDFNLPRHNNDKIRFQLINNLIVVPIEINGVELSFILDSGVSKPILFNITNTDSLQIKNVETIFLRGLGEGGEPIEALRSRNNFFKIGNAININQDIFVVFDNSINFTNRLGINVHGIIGYDLFKNFVIEINYINKFIRLYKPEKYVYKKCKKCEVFNLTLYNNKPYIETAVKVDSLLLPIKLLIDTGSSDALWLFEDESLGLEPLNNMYFDDFIGKGLSGNVYGKRSKVKLFKLKSFELEDVNVAFPDSSSISTARRIKGRNGSVSGEILKRFNLIVDYKNAKITLKKNSNFRTPFYYNRSGIVLEQTGSRVVKEKEDRGRVGYGNTNDNETKIELSTYYKYTLKPAYSIVELRKGSPAEKAGLKIGDEIISINGKKSHELKLQRIMEYFKNDIGKLIRMKIERDGEVLPFEFRLEDVFKQKELPN